MVRKNIPVNTSGKDLSSTGGRLAYERNRIGMTVADFGLQCGVTKQTQIKYEADQNYPDTRYLAAAMDKGVDVMYVLTGRRDVEAMPDVHQNLIEAFEAASKPLRDAVFAVLLSPYWGALLKKPQDMPGYFQHQVLGEEDTRFEEQYEAERKARHKGEPGF